MAEDTFRSPLFGGLLGGVRRGRTTSTQRVGTSGTPIIGGYIVTNERNPLLHGQNRYLETSNILANVSIVAAGLRYYLNLLSKAGWTVEPAQGEEINESEAERFAELVEQMLYDMEQPWHRIIRRAGAYRLHGFSIQEWTAKRREDGAIGMLDVEARPQATIDRWDVDVSGTVFGVVQNHVDTGQPIYIPRSKVVYLVDDSLSDSPEGLGLARHLFEPAQRLRRFQLLEAYGFETDLRGIPVVRAPIGEMAELDESQRGKALAPLTNFIENHVKNPEMGLLLDSDVYRGEGENAAPAATYKWGVELLQGSGNGAEPVAAAIERINREMARVLGVEGLLLGGEKVGSMALSQDKSQNFALMVDSSLAEIAETFERDLVKTIFLLNGWPEELVPTLKPDQTQYRDVTQITQGLVDMASAGAVLDPDDPSINSVRDLLGMPRIDLESRREAQEEAEAARREALANALRARQGESGDDEDTPDQETGDDVDEGEDVDDLDEENE